MIPLIIHDQFYTIQNLQRSQILQTINWSGTLLFLTELWSKNTALQTAIDLGKPMGAFFQWILKSLTSCMFCYKCIGHKNTIALFGTSNLTQKM